MTVRARRLWGATLQTANATTLMYTVPDGRTVAMTFLNLALSSTGTGLVIVRLNSTTADPLSFSAYAGSPQHFQLLQGARFNPGDDLYVVVPANVVCYSAGFGSLLDGEPS